MLSGLLYPPVDGLAADGAAVALVAHARNEATVVGVATEEEDTAVVLDLADSDAGGCAGLGALFPEVSDLNEGLGGVGGGGVEAGA